MTGSVSQAAASAASTGSRPAPGGAVSDIILAVTERQITPGETASFPFAARTAYGIPAIHDFNEGYSRDCFVTCNLSQQAARLNER
jgi:hypothetical protein